MSTNLKINGLMNLTYCSKLHTISLTQSGKGLPCVAIVSRFNAKHEIFNLYIMTDKRAGI
jgi:hypothetical protein